MSDLLDAFGTEGSELAQDLQRPSCYLSQRAKCDFVAEVKAAGFHQHDNEESSRYGEPFFLLELVVDEIAADGPGAFGEEKRGGKYVDVALRVGDPVGVYIYTSKAGVKKSAAKASFTSLARLAATFSGRRDVDFYPGATPGPQGIRAVFGDGTLMAGKKVRISADSVNDKGYSNPTVELIPDDEPVVASKGRKK